MDEITTEKEVLQEQKELIINQAMRNHLLIYSKWGMFFGILAYIGAIFMFLLSILYMFVDLGNSEYFNVLGSSLRYIFIILFLAYAIIYFIGGRMTIQSSKSTKMGILQYNQEEIEKGTKKLSSLMSFMGIVTIAGIVLYIIFMIAMVIFSISSAIKAL